MDQDCDVDQLTDAVDRHPLVSLICAGDVKGVAGAVTQLVDQLSQDPPDERCWVDLRWVPAAVVAERVAVAVGAPTTPSRRAERGLIDHLRQRRALLILYASCRVLTVCASLVLALRRDCPGVRVLAVTPRPLGLEGELIISGPPQQSDGVSAFDQSYRRLSSAAIGALTTLAAFRGGFTIDDAEAACPDNLRPNLSEIVADLRRAGLVVEDLSSRGLSNRNPHEPVSVAPKPGERLDLPRTVRRITEEQSASRSAAARDRHARHFAAMSAAAEIGLNGRDQARWVHRLSLERDNLSAALGWLASRDDPEQALAMAGALGRFWWLTGSFVEGQHALRSVLSRPGADRPTVGRASALHALGLATFWHETRPAQARASATQFSEAVTIYRRCGEQARLARAARDLGAQCNSVGDAGRAWQLLNESVTLARRLGDVATAGVSLAYLGIVASYQDKRTEARALLEEALVLLSGEGSDDEVIRAQFFLACLECDDGNPVAARARFAALVNGRQLIATLPYAAPFALDGLARLAAVENRYDDALGVYGAATAAHQRLGTSAGAGYARYRHRGLDAARDSCGTDAAALIDSGRGWSIPQAVELGLTTNQPRAEPLHSRQLDVLRLAEAGLADTQIARQLFLSPRTVSNHLSATYRRLGVHNRLAAVQRARHLGLL